MLKQVLMGYDWCTLVGKPLPNSVLYFPGLNPNSTTILDYSGYANDTTINGAVWKVLPIGLPYLYFDGTNDYLRPGNDVEYDITTAISCGAWVNLDAVGTDSFVIGRDDVDTNRNFFLYVLAAGTARFLIYISDVAKIGYSPTTLSGAKWHLVGGSYDKVNVRCYLDGAKGTVTAATANIDNDDVPLEIGSRETKGDMRFKGGIALPFLRNVNMTDEDWVTKFQRERVLFGV